MHPLGYAPRRSASKLGVALRAMRETVQYSQEAWAILLGVDRGTVIRWERGVFIPRTPVLRFLRELGKRPEWRAAIHKREDVERLLVELGLVEDNVRAA